MAARLGQMSHCSGSNRSYIYCLCARLQTVILGSDVSGLGILVAPISSTFWVSLGGYFNLHFFIPREEVLINNALNSCGLVILRRVLTTILFLQDGESTATGTPATGKPDVGR